MKINPYPKPFIVIEGIDGCGKTTLIEGLQKWDKEKKYGSIFTKEPTDGESGKKIREILGNNGRDENGRKVEPKELQEMYIRDRLEHRQTEAIFLEKYPIFSDRDFPSTVVYGLTEGLNAKWIWKKHREIIGDLFFIPDLILILDLEAGKAMERSKESGKAADYFEKKLATREKLRKGYDYFFDIAVPAGINVQITDASVSPEEILKSCLTHIEFVFKTKYFFLN